MNQVTTAAFAETAIVTYRAIKAGKAAAPKKAGDTPGATVKGVKSQSPYVMPLPSEYTSVVVVFAALHFVPNERIAGLIGWGLVLATVLNLWQPSSQSATGAPAKK